MVLAPKPEPAGKRTRGRVMSGDAAAAEARIMEGLAREAAGLGVEIVDVAGNIEEVSARVEQQARSFTGLVASAGEVNDSNRRIATAAGDAREKAGQTAENVPTVGIALGGERGCQPV